MVALTKLFTALALYYEKKQYLCSVITIIPNETNRKLYINKVYMKKLIAAIAIMGLTMFSQTIVAQDSLDNQTVEEMLAEEGLDPTELMAEETPGLHSQLKTKFVDGNPAFMSLVAIVLVLGLTLCIERIVYLTLSEINAKKLLKDIDAKVEQGDVEGAKELCRNTRGPVASVCYQGLMHIKEPIDDVERSIMSYGTVQVANMEKGCSWIKLFIALAPSLGFLGTVIGMVMAFDQIQELGDINPTIVASGMKVALITTIFGIVVAVILQLFYNYIVSKIEHLTSQMEESAVTLLDTITQFKRSRNDV